MKVPQLIIPGSYINTAPDVTPQVAHAASLLICGHAKDVADARVLLGALGLPGGTVARVVTTLACGHPSTEGVRHARYGVVCRTCDRSRFASKPTVFRPGCGTRAGYAVHRRAGEAACEGCLTAERVRTRAARAAKAAKS